MKFMISFTHTKGEMADRVPRWEVLTRDEKQAVANRFKDFATELQAEQGVRMVFFGAPAEARTLSTATVKSTSPRVRSSTATSLSAATSSSRRSRWTKHWHGRGAVAGSSAQTKCARSKT
jgi:hypothetical protein